MAEAFLIAASASKLISGAAGSYSEYKGIQLETEFEASQFETNSRIAELQAKDAERRGREDANAYKVKIKQLIGKQRAAMAAQGIEIDADSALDIQLETAELGELDAMTIKNNAFREATGHRIQALDYSSQSGYTRIAGKTKARNTLLTGGMSAVDDIISLGEKF